MVAHTVPETMASFWTGSDGQPWHYVKSGSGPPLLLLHGFLGSGFCWRLNLPVIATCRSTYSVDLPGFGLSDALHQTDCGMQAQAKRLAEFMEHHGLEQVDIVGSSWGGGVALLLAAQSARVRSLALSAPVNPWSQLGHDRIRFCAGFFGRTLIRFGLPFSRRVHHIALERMYGDPARIPPGTLEGYSEQILRRGRGRGLINILRCWENDLDAINRAIPHVHVPTLLIWGSRDSAVDIRSAGPLRDAIGQSRCHLEVLLGVGHLPFEESPEVFNRLVLDFVARPG